LVLRSTIGRGRPYFLKKMRVLVYCAGIEINDLARNLLLAERKSKNIRLYRVKLDETTVALTSPFYEHLITLSEEGTLVTWHSATCRVHKAEDISPIVKACFFPLLTPCPTNNTWQRELYPWETFHNGLATKYRNGFDPKYWEGQEWVLFRSTYKEELSGAIKALSFSKSDALAATNILSYLYGLLKRWKGFGSVSGYYSHRLLEMREILSLQSVGLKEVPIATLPIEEVRDLSRFYAHLDDPMRKMPSYIDYGRLLSQTLKGKLPLVLKTLVEPGPRIRERIIDVVIIEKISLDLQHRALSDKGTVFPVTLKLIHFYYRALFQFEEGEVASPLKINLTNPTPPIEDEDAVLFEMKHFEEVVKRFINNAKWRNVLGLETVLGQNTVLFVLQCKEALNKVERDLEQLFSQRIKKSVSLFFPPLSSEWNVEEWQTSFDTLDDIDLGLFDLRITVLDYAPSELKECKDLQSLALVLRDNSFTTTIVRANGSTITLKRASLFLSRQEEVDLPDFHRIMVEVQNLNRFGNDMMNVFVLDTHLLSIEEMFTLFTWCLAHRNVVKRLVLMGSTDILPLHTEGHAFLDLLQWYDQKGMQLRLFRPKVFLSQLEQLRELSRLTLCSLQGLEDFLSRRSAKLDLVLVVGDWESTLPKGKTTSLEDDILTHTTLKFRKKRELTMVVVDVGKLAFLPIKEGKKPLFLISLTLLEAFKRNELNHLFLAVDEVIVLCKRKSDSLPSMKLQTFPNLRHTLPYMNRFSSPIGGLL
jgi:hypothetical protein